MTTLTKPIVRETRKTHQGRPVIVTLAPAGSQPEALLGFKLKGQRTQYLMTVSDAFRIAALWYGQKEAAAKRLARRQGIPWREAMRQFLKEVSLP